MGKFKSTIQSIFKSLIGTLCLYSCDSELRTADLAFVFSDSSGFDGAISSATASKGNKDYSHVGIVEQAYDGTYILEAVPPQGVTRTPIEEFIKVNQNIDFYRLNEVYPEDVIERAKSHLGEDYDYTFLPDNGMMYCSELVFDAFRHTDGSPIFDASPMNFYSPDGSLDNFWTELFESLNMDVPQGVPGTNPNGMSQSVGLKLIKKIRSEN